MPTWNFVLPEGTLAREEKDAIAPKITQIYTDGGLPAFYVHIFFDEYPVGGYYNGGKTPAKSALLTISHVARHFASEEESSTFHKRVDSILRPVFEPKGLTWEYNVLLPSQDNWRIDGIVPPTADNPELLKQWAERNAAVPA
ncbi:MAG: hypothetical protein Q9165_008364 [Trypethelium subeluteriae]